MLAKSSRRNVDEEKSKYWVRKAASYILISITGGVALSALDDLSIYHNCSKAMEKVSKNQEIINALGDPIVKGPWYNASLAVAHKGILSLVHFLYVALNAQVSYS